MRRCEVERQRQDRPKLAPQQARARAAVLEHRPDPAKFQEASWPYLISPKAKEFDPNTLLFENLFRLGSWRMAEVSGKPPRRFPWLPSRGGDGQRQFLRWLELIVIDHLKQREEQPPEIESDKLRAYAEQLDRRMVAVEEPAPEHDADEETPKLRSYRDLCAHVEDRRVRYRVLLTSQWLLRERTTNRDWQA